MSDDDKLAQALGLAEFGLGDAWVRVDGHRYVAVDGHKGVMCCTGGPRCVFSVGFGCDLMLPTGFDTRCQPNRRTDGRGIVWMLPT